MTVYRWLLYLLAGGIAGRQVVRARHQGVDHAEVHAHVPHGLAAHGAGVVVAGVLPEAVAVHEMPTGQLLQQGTLLSRNLKLSRFQVLGFYVSYYI